ncbi:MAG: transposase [Chloroflexi bacterium]|nr:transposase [Chloroflexota bacterium]
MNPSPIEGSTAMTQRLGDVKAREVLREHERITHGCLRAHGGSEVKDDYGTHKTALIQRWLAKRPRYHLHFTPTSASWLNLVQRWFALLTERQIRRGAHPSTKALEEAIYRYLHVTNEQPQPFVWTKTADEILTNTARFCFRTSGTGS